MKKLYLSFTTVMALLISTIATAQCPNGFAFPFKYSGSCYVFVTNTLTNADINVYAGVTRINTTEAQTNATGQGTVFFDCSQTITRVVLTRPDGTACEISGANIAVLATLPVKLSDFKARLNGATQATIQWTTEFELESAKYYVQRSIDGTNYTTIGTINAAGNSLESKRYTFDDLQLGERAAYYRLQMVDIDGKSSLSKTIYVNNRKGNIGNGPLRVFPNPFKSDLQLVGISASDVNRKGIRLYNVAGKEIGFTVTGANAITIDASAPSGVYVLRVQDKYFKLVKE